MQTIVLLWLGAGTSLINLALGFRLKNKQQCLTQAMAFLFNNMRLTENSQVHFYLICFHSRSPISSFGIVVFSEAYDKWTIRFRHTYDLYAVNVFHYSVS